MTTHGFVEDVLNTPSGSTLELDLKNFSTNQGMEFIMKAFEHEFVLSDMIKISLIVGAGKEKRQKYDVELPKAISSALRAAGYKEDATSDRTFESSGTFKYHHDLGRNLKIVHVFPKAIKGEVKNEEKKDVEDKEEDDVSENEELVDEFAKLLVGGIPKGYAKDEWFCVKCGKDEFEKALTKDNRLTTWTQKKRCQEFLKKCLNLVKESEKKLANMKELNEEEEIIYNESVDIETKILLLQREVRNDIESNKLCKSEKTLALSELEEKIKSESDDKKREILLKRKNKLENVKAREADAFSFMELPVETTVNLKKMLRKSLPLRAIEEKAGSKGLWSSKLSPDEVALLKSKIEMDKEIEDLIKSTRETRWKDNFFQTEKEFNDKLNDLTKGLKSETNAKIKELSKVKSAGIQWNEIKPTKKATTNFKSGTRQPNTGAFQAFLE